jgi:hypothetical protein
LGWELKWGQKIDFYNKLLVKNKIKEEDREPEISAFSYYIDCFWELSTTRNNGMGVGPIPFTAIAEFAKIYNEDIEEFVYLMRRLDAVFLKHCEKENG